jgi:hypothetical protein
MDDALSGHGKALADAPGIGIAQLRSRGDSKSGKSVGGLTPDTPDVGDVKGQESVVAFARVEQVDNPVAFLGELVGDFRKRFRGAEADGNRNAGPLADPCPDFAGEVHQVVRGESVEGRKASSIE